LKFCATCRDIPKHVSSEVLEDSDGSDYLEDDQRPSNGPKVDGK